MAATSRIQTGAFAMAALMVPVVMVVGAGRGPLVRRVRKAAQRYGRDISDDGSMMWRIVQLQ